MNQMEIGDFSLVPNFLTVILIRWGKYEIHFLFRKKAGTQLSLLGPNLLLHLLFFFYLGKSVNKHIVRIFQPHF